jgi:hypothetical protein
MTTLRSRLIRLAAARPALRPHLLPLLKRSSEVSYLGDVYRVTVITELGYPRSKAYEWLDVLDKELGERSNAQATELKLGARFLEVYIYTEEDPDTAPDTLRRAVTRSILRYHYNNPGLFLGDEEGLHLPPYKENALELERVENS